MAFEIIWSAEAENDFREIVRYFNENWSQAVAEKFIIAVAGRLNSNSYIAIHFDCNSDASKIVRYQMKMRYKR